MFFVIFAIMNQHLKRMKHISLWTLALLSFFSCADRGYEQAPNGIIVTLQQEQPTDVRKVRLQVINDKMIRVSATPEEEFANEKSLIIVPQSDTRTPFSIEETDSTLVLRTAALRAGVHRRTGEVSFADANGNAILREDTGGGKRFTPVNIEGTKGYATRQVFQSSDGEALYGLGQHQADEFNYKGKNESLFQYNTKVSVPFIVSTGNYGILWDNYSLGRFGDDRDYAQLNENFNLFDANGKEGGLTAVYTPAKWGTKNTQPVTRIESTICYEDTKSVKNLPKNLPIFGAKVTYTGAIEPRESGTYRFHLYYAGYVKVYLDNEPIVPERWRTAWNPNSYKFAVHLEVGRRVPLRIEWQPDGNESYLGLRALNPVAEEEQNKTAIY
jgi:alpha-D-xyloside xylohydrolase